MVDKAEIALPPVDDKEMVDEDTETAQINLEKLN